VRKVKISLIAGIAAGLLAGTVAGVAAETEVADPMAAGVVTGEIWFAPSCKTPLPEAEGEVFREYGYRCDPQRWTSDDPRLGGEATVAWNADVHTVDGRSYSVTASAWDIRGDAGGWACSHTNGLDEGRGLFTTSIQGSDRLTCSGSGANEGLGAILVADWSGNPKTFEGLIFPGGIPPAPDPTAE
jgi:hypothetical protein